MTSFGRIAVLAFATLVSTAAAQAGVYKVKSGVPTRIGDYGGYARGSCLATALPEITVVTPAEHGKLVWSREEITIKTNDNCAGKTMLGLAFTYTANPGYKGKDRAVLEFRTEYQLRGIGMRGDTREILFEVQ